MPPAPMEPRPLLWMLPDERFHVPIQVSGDAEHGVILVFLGLFFLHSEISQMQPEPTILLPDEESAHHGCSAHESKSGSTDWRLRGQVEKGCPNTGNVGVLINRQHKHLAVPEAREDFPQRL